MLNLMENVWIGYMGYFWYLLVDDWSLIKKFDEVSWYENLFVYFL